MMEEIAVKKDGYQVKLTNFQGPLDLLLYLIRKEEIDIYDIPVAQITMQYLEYIKLMRELDLEVAGEFILMAATLIRIKAKMLLPKDPDAPEEDEEDPRADLVRQLLEYKRFKEVAEDLYVKEDKQRRYFPRTYFDWSKDLINDEDNTAQLIADVDLFDLLSAFKLALENRPRETSHQVGEVGATIDDQINYITGFFLEHEKATFAELVAPLETRLLIIVTFIALLEMIRNHRIFVRQGDVFGEIYISRE